MGTKNNLHQPLEIIVSMPRPSKFSPERVEIRKQAERIVNWIRVHGPVTMGDILQAWKENGEKIEPHVLNRTSKITVYRSCGLHFRR